MTEKQYIIIDFLKQQDLPLTHKEIAISLGSKDVYNYALPTLIKLESEGLVERVRFPCAPTRWKYKNKKL